MYIGLSEFNFEFVIAASISSIAIGPILVQATLGKFSNKPSKLSVFGLKNLCDIKCNFRYADSVDLIGPWSSPSSHSISIILLSSGLLISK